MPSQKSHGCKSNGEHKMWSSFWTSKAPNSMPSQKSHGVSVVSYRLTELFGGSLSNRIASVHRTVRAVMDVHMGHWNLITPVISQVLYPSLSLWDSAWNIEGVIFHQTDRWVQYVGGCCGEYIIIITDFYSKWLSIWVNCQQISKLQMIFKHKLRFCQQFHISK